MLVAKKDGVKIGSWTPKMKKATEIESNYLIESENYFRYYLPSVIIEFPEKVQFFIPQFILTTFRKNF